MDGRKIGIIVLVVVALVVVVWRGMKYLGPGPGVASPAQAEEGKARMMRMQQGGGTGAPSRGPGGMSGGMSGGMPAGMSGGMPGGMRPPGN